MEKFREEALIDMRIVSANSCASSPPSSPPLPSSSSSSSSSTTTEPRQFSSIQSPKSFPPNYCDRNQNIGDKDDQDDDEEEEDGDDNFQLDTDPTTQQHSTQYSELNHLGTNHHHHPGNNNNFVVSVHEPSPNSSTTVTSRGLRKGKWTEEEDNYANRIIEEFQAGFLPLLDGTTLRTFLSKLLNCDPMRISKKFVGINCIGKQVFRRQQGDNDISTEEIERRRRELAELESRFLAKLSEVSSSTRAQDAMSKKQQAGKKKATRSSSPHSTQVNDRGNYKSSIKTESNPPLIGVNSIISGANPEVDNRHWSSTFNQSIQNTSSRETSYRSTATIPNLFTSIPHYNSNYHQSPPSQHQSQVPALMIPAPTFSAQSNQKMFEQLQVHQNSMRIPRVAVTSSNQEKDHSLNQQQRQQFVNVRAQSNEERGYSAENNFLQFRRSKSNEESIPMLGTRLNYHRSQSNEESSTLGRRNPFYAPSTYSTSSLANARKRLSHNNLGSHPEVVDESQDDLRINDDDADGGVVTDGHNGNGGMTSQPPSTKRRITTSAATKRVQTVNPSQIINTHEPSSPPPLYGSSSSSSMPRYSPGILPVSLPGFDQDEMGTRNGSVEDFLSLVENGTIPPPEEPESPINVIFAQQRLSQLNTSTNPNPSTSTSTTDEAMLQQLRQRQQGPPVRTSTSTTDEAMLQQLRQRQQGPPVRTSTSTTDEAMLQQLRQRQQGPPVLGKKSQSPPAHV